MRKYFLLTLIMSILFIPIVTAFSPPPPDEGKIQLCESTGGTKNITYMGGYDSETGMDRAIATIVNCDCPVGLSWNMTMGCIKAESFPSVSTQRQDNINLYFTVGILIIILLAIRWLLRKK